MGRTLVATLFGFVDREEELDISVAWSKCVCVRRGTNLGYAKDTGNSVMAADGIFGSSELHVQSTWFYTRSILLGTESAAPPPLTPLCTKFSP